MIINHSIFIFVTVILVVSLNRVMWQTALLGPNRCHQECQFTQEQRKTGSLTATEYENLGLTMTMMGPALSFFSHLCNLDDMQPLARSTFLFVRSRCSMSECVRG